MSVETVDIFQIGRHDNLFVGRPFSISYTHVNILTSDYWKNTVWGIPQGCFLLALYQGEPNQVAEALLLRALGPIRLPNDSNIISSMIEYYKDDVEVSGRAGSSKNSQLDEFTRHEFSFSGLECRILGSFYKTNGRLEFGADIENFYAAHNYRVYKATGPVLGQIVNQKDNLKQSAAEAEFPIGAVRYSSARRFQTETQADPDLTTGVGVRISPEDFLAKRTALFGMTRTGKSNTVKKIIEATVEISQSRQSNPELVTGNSNQQLTRPEVGQIVFDINGEYANPNLQDDGTAIYELYKETVKRYSVVKKDGFAQMRLNFYKQAEAGFTFISNYLKERSETADYVGNFLAISLEKPPDYEENWSARTRYDRRQAAYFCCLMAAGFKVPANFTVSLEIPEEFKKDIQEKTPLKDPGQRIDLETAGSWLKQVWQNYEDHPYFKKYEKQKGREWADNDLKSLLVFLSCKKKPGSDSSNISGFRKLNSPDLKNLHTASRDSHFSEEINQQIRQGDIIIVDLSQGSADIQKIFSEDICRQIFNQSLRYFTENKPNNIIQFYFEEAHNLFPKKENKDLTDIYNRIAKEGAKLNLGLIYATQEVSSISANILKNTQNWFISHLNNDDELKELKKYYDFSDFADSLIRFSADTDRGFIRMKTHTNPFVVPVQVDRFQGSPSKS